MTIVPLPPQRWFSDTKGRALDRIGRAMARHDSHPCPDCRADVLALIED